MSPSSRTLEERGRRQYKSREERRREIVDATLAILAERGMHAWTTSALAERVGVAEATLFKHFESKDDILGAALHQQARELRERIEAYRPEGGPWERAAGLVRHVLDYLQETEGGPMVILLGHASRIRPEMQEEVARTRALFQGRLTELFGEAVRSAEAELKDGGGPGSARRLPDPGGLARLGTAIIQSTALQGMVEGGDWRLRRVADPMIEALGCCLARSEEA